MALGGNSAGVVAVDVEGDFSKFRQGMQKEGSAAGGKFGSSFGSSFGSKIATLGATYLGANFLKGTINEASDLAESVNVTGLAFGDARASADDFAKGSADAIGLSESAARSLQAQLGNIIVGFGASKKEAATASEELIRRASDIGSAWNAGTDEVSEAITAAFTSSTEPIRKFGVIIDQAAIKQRALELGLIGSGDELDNNSKRLAVTSLIMEQTNNVAGDFKNTQDGVANSSKTVGAMWTDMQAQLGQALLPVLQSLLGFMRTLGPEGMKIVLVGAAMVLGFVKIAQAGQALSGVFTVLSANPWVLAALVLIGIGVAIWKNWDTIKEKGKALIGWFVGAAETIGGVFVGVKDAIAGPFKAAFNAVATAWNSTVGKLSFSIPSWVPFVGGKTFTAPKIPQLASGAVLSSPTLAMVGEYAGANRNPEIVSPRDMMKSTMLEALGQAGGGGNVYVDVTINGTGLSAAELRDAVVEPVARELDRRYRREARAVGRPELRR